jgi:hypothetical protein
MRRDQLRHHVDSELSFDFSPCLTNSDRLVIGQSLKTSVAGEHSGSALIKKYPVPVSRQQLESCETDSQAESNPAEAGMENGRCVATQ